MSIYQKIFSFLCLLLLPLMTYLLTAPAFVPDKGAGYYLLSAVIIAGLVCLFLITLKVNEWAWHQDGWYRIGDIRIRQYGYTLNRLLRMLLLAGTIALIISIISLLAHREMIYLRNMGMLFGFQIMIYLAAVWFRSKFPIPGKDYL